MLHARDDAAPVILRAEVRGLSAFNPERRPASAFSEAPGVWQTDSPACRAISITGDGKNLLFPLMCTYHGWPRLNSIARRLSQRIQGSRSGRVAQLQLNNHRPGIPEAVLKEGCYRYRFCPTFTILQSTIRLRRPQFRIHEIR